MLLYSWNVNGVRAAVKKGLIEQIEGTLQSPDILCLQETKAQDEQVAEALEALNGYHVYSNSATKKGYSGVAILTKEAPLSIQADLGIDEHDQEGRVLAAEFKDFILVTVYTPNSQNELARLSYREQWDIAFKEYLKALAEKKPVVVCGDLNVAHTELDLARPASNYNKSAGYTQLEIDGLSAILNEGFIDSWRMLNPTEVKYTWWSFRANARAKNIGWRIDYFLVDQALKSNLGKAIIRDDVNGSDHCPIGIEMEF